jgi:YegS/Rv2252/BmrU family lipid kinase
MEPYLGIMNPAAGGGRCGRQAPEAIRRLRDAGVEMDVVRTGGPGDATRLARDAYDKGRRHFVAIGGDGTGYEIVNGLFTGSDDEADDDPPRLGFLPMGTGNSFLKDFTNEGAEYSIRAIIENRSRKCDVIRVNHRRGVLHYINIFSIGFVADVNGLRDRRFRRFGELGYVFGVLAEVARLRMAAFPMSVDEGPMDREPVTFVSVNNSRFTGGKMMMAPDADTADGLADLIRVGELGRIGLLQTFPKIFNGTHVRHPSVTATKVKCIDFEIEQEIDVMVDGEALRMVPRRLEVLPGALEVSV